MICREENFTNTLSKKRFVFDPLFSKFCFRLIISICPLHITNPEIPVGLAHFVQNRY